MTVQGWFANNTADIEPGHAAVLELTITNLAAGTESFALTPTGLAAAYSAIRPAYITLFGGAQETVEVEVTAPRLPSTTAGATALGVRIVPQHSPDDVEQVEVTLHIAATFDRRLQMLQPAIRSRRRAVYEMMVENSGNTQASCRMHLIDPTGRVDGDFDPPAVGVEPGGSTLVRLKLRAVKRQWPRRSRTLPFRVDADQQGAPTAAAGASLIQAPIVAERLWGRIAALAAVGAVIVGAWVGIVNPAIDRAAERAVAGTEPAVTVTTVATPTGVGSPTPVVTSPPIAVLAGDADGEPLTVSLPSGGPANELTEQTYIVPAGSTFLITDIFVLNPFGDEGTATLQVGATRFEWDLVNLDGVDATKQFVTPLGLPADQPVVFTVACGAIGRQGGTGCSTTAVVNGRLARE